MNSRIFIVLLCLILGAACQSNLISEEKHLMDKDPWSFNEFVDFSLEVQDTTIQYDLILEVQHHPDFSFQNFYTKVYTIFPSSKEVASQVSLQIADNMGTWLGKCNSSSCRVELLLQERFRFKEIGKHQIKIENYSREELSKLQAFTLKLYKYQEIKN